MNSNQARMWPRSFPIVVRRAPKTGMMSRLRGKWTPPLLLLIQASVSCFLDECNSLLTGVSARSLRWFRAQLPACSATQSVNASLLSSVLLVLAPLVELSAPPYLQSLRQSGVPPTTIWPPQPTTCSQYHSRGWRATGLELFNTQHQHMSGTLFHSLSVTPPLCPFSYPTCLSKPLTLPYP